MIRVTSATSLPSQSLKFKSTTSVRESKVLRVAEETAIEEEVVSALRVVLLLAAAAVVAEEEAAETEVLLVLRTPKAVSEVAETLTTLVEETALLRTVTECKLLRTARRDATTEAEVLETTRVALPVLRVVFPAEVARETATREVADAPTTLVSVPRSRTAELVRVVLKASREPVLLAVRVLPEAVPMVPRRPLPPTPRPRNELSRQLLENYEKINLKKKDR